MEILHSMLDTLSHISPIALFFTITLLTAGKSTIGISSFLPPASLMLILIFGVCLPFHSPILLWLATSLGALLGSIASYQLGRSIYYFPRLKKWVTRYQAKILRIQQLLKNKAFFILFISRFLAVFRYLTPFSAGLLKLPIYGIYLTSAVSALVWSGVFILIANGVLSISL
ncbi:TPA: DedA family protein [Proteus mirabilis]|nr:VTT domain-containing protein [Proteus mirabilis]HEJ9412617.1 VTT domain-containing protein [Proteus mirabilis]HEJ9438894.1 VTT domain-containing protein [Proteus mirabilis]HEJ9660294.1 VTT domain-containing protein [Proteus mirabilis]HEK1720731.1 VTT domain-containing protein [Proteus mirabilis]